MDNLKEMQNLNIVLPDKNDLKNWFLDYFNDMKPELINALLDAARKEDKKIRYYTRDEIMEILHITSPTLARHEKLGMPSTSIGGKKLYNLQAIENYFQEKKRK